MLATESSNPHATNAVIGKEDGGENLIGHTPSAHAQPDGKTDQHVTEDAARKGRDRIERDLAARDPDHRLPDRAVAHGVHAGQPY